MIKVLGLKELRKKLNKLPPKVATRVMRNASRAGAAVVREEAQKTLVSNTSSYNRGKLAIQRSRSKSTKWSHLWHIGPKAEHWPLIFLELGAEPHEITINKKKTLSSNGEAFGAKVQHPGVEAIHFLERALRENHKEIVEAIKARARKGIEKEARKK